MKTTTQTNLYDSPCRHCAHCGCYSPNRAMLEESPYYCDCTHQSVFTYTENPNETCPNFLDEKTTNHRAGMFKSIFTLLREAGEGNKNAEEQMFDRIQKGILR